MYRVDSDLFSTASPSLNDAEIASRFQASNSLDGYDEDDEGYDEDGEGDEGDDDDDDDEEGPRSIFHLSTPEHYVLSTALKTRVLVFGVAFLATSMVGTYDSSSSLLSPNHNYHPMFLCPSNWDGAFHVKIASERGYLYEQSHAFFPLFPLVMAVTQQLGYWLTLHGGFNLDDLVVMGLAGTAVNTILFLAASVLFYRLSSKVFDSGLGKRRHRNIAMRASILFCFNPASIFFSVAYSESLFTVFALAGMLLLQPAVTGGRKRQRKRQRQRRVANVGGGVVDFKHRMLASLCFAGATLTRSNGSLLGLFSLYAAWRAYDKGKQTNRTLTTHVLQLAAVTAVHGSALLTVLGHGWFKYCWNKGVRRPWCDYTVPNIYSFVQAEYWNLGLFSYYEMKQLPNFLVAFPAVALCVGALVRYWKEGERGTGIPPPFALQMILSLLIAASVMHIQVFTRFICSSAPMFYWHAAVLTQRETGIAYFVLLYFTFFLLLGTSMFCSYFPWT
ncbi:hypothetical protein BASA81_001133 [Batrachochytrium salamandrivorans]|nr:hypothetical protein BASA81_001133 [Batrachochytrium salamandrivorans]